MKKLFQIYIILNSHWVFGQIGGAYPHQSLNLVSSARIVSLGGNLNMVRDEDLNLAVQNPALLNSKMNKQLTVGYVNYFADANAGVVAGSKELKNKSMLAASLQYLNYGKFVASDASGEVTGNFTSNDYNVGLSYGKQLDSSFNVGAAIKTLFSQYFQANAVAVAVDLAMNYHSTKNMFSYTFLIKNLGTEIKPFVKGNREKVPFQVQAGISKKLKHVPFRISFAFEQLQKYKLHASDTGATSIFSSTNVPQKQKKYILDNLARHIVVGGELLITKNFNVRLGYNYRIRQELKVDARKAMVGFSFGFGFKVSKFQFNYGRMAYSLAGASNIFSISTRLADFKK